MTMFSGVTYSDFDRELCKDTIYSNILHDLEKILRAMKFKKIPLDSIDKAIYVNRLFDRETGNELTPRIVRAVEALWSDPGVQKCFRGLNEDRFRLNDPSG